MSCHVSIHPELPIVECVFFDVVSAVEFIAGMKESIRLATLNNPPAGERGQLLVDCFAIQGNCSITDMFFALEELAQYQGNALRRLQQAMILPEKLSMVVPFYYWETLCHNRGYEVRWFSARPPALYWLLKKAVNRVPECVG